MPLETLSELDAARLRHPQVPTDGSVEQSAALERFAEFYALLEPDRVRRLFPATFHEDVYFNDTLKSVRGNQRLLAYLLESAEAAEACRVEVLDACRSADGEQMIRWRMMIRFRRFRRGIDTWSIGTSHVRFGADGRVVYQQDYWNAADGLYQHLPLLGTLIRLVKRRI